MNKLIVLFLFFCILSCGNVKNRTKLDNTKIAILKCEGSIQVSEKDILLAEELINRRLKIFNEEENAQNNDFNYVLNDSLHFKKDEIVLSNYYRQYCVIKNEKREKILNLNCLCYLDKQSISNWRKSTILVKDGGNCYFQISVNLDRKIVFGFMRNGNS